MMKVEKRASAHLPMADTWLERGEALARLIARTARGVDSWLNRVFSGLAAAQARRAARRELYALDDRMLADIGLRRDQVAECVDGMFRADSDASGASTPAAAPAEDITEINPGNDSEYKTAA